MQLSREELSKLDLIIERYTDDKTSKEAVAIESYLNKINSLERELLIDVYFNLSRKATDEESKIIDKHKTKLYNLLTDSKVKSRKESLRKKSRLENEHKIKRLSRLKKLNEEITILHNRLYSLELELKNYDSVTVTSYKSEKVNTSSKSYNFGSFKISSEIETIKNIISKKVIKWEEERNYLNDIFEQIKDIKVQQVFYYRYINGFTWDEISSEVKKSKPWCNKKHSEYIKQLQL